MACHFCHQDYLDRKVIVIIWRLLKYRKSFNNVWWGCRTINLVTLSIIYLCAHNRLCYCNVRLLAVYGGWGLLDEAVTHQNNYLHSYMVIHSHLDRGFELVCHKRQMNDHNLEITLVQNLFYCVRIKSALHFLQIMKDVLATCCQKRKGNCHATYITSGYVP